MTVATRLQEGCHLQTLVCQVAVAGAQGSAQAQEPGREGKAHQLDRVVPSTSCMAGGGAGCGEGGGGGGGANPSPGRPRGRTWAGAASSVPVPAGPSPRPGSQPSRRRSWWPALDSPKGGALLPTNP